MIRGERVDRRRGASTGAQLRLYLSRQAASPARYLIEQAVLELFGWIPTIVGIGVRAIAYRAILRMDGLAPDAIADDEPLFGARLGLDSVDALELVVALERELGVTIPSEAIGGETFATVGQLAAWLAPQLEPRLGAVPSPAPEPAR